MHGRKPSADEFQCHKSSYCWKLGEARVELSQTSSGGVCPCLYLHLGLQPPDFPENKSLWLYPAEGLYCSNPGEHIE